MSEVIRIVFFGDFKGVLMKVRKGGKGIWMRRGFVSLEELVLGGFFIVFIFIRWDCSRKFVGSGLGM